MELFQKLFKIKQQLNMHFLKVSLFTGFSTLVRMVTGFVSIKVVAVIIGPAGIALLGQLNNFATVAMSFASAGINNGVTKYVSEFKEESLKLKFYISTALAITVVCSLTTGLFIILFSKTLSGFILKDITYYYVFTIFGFTIILFALNSFAVSVINGFKDFNRFVKVSIVSSIIGLLFSIVLVLVWNLKGALISAVTFQSVVFFVNLRFFIKAKWFNRSIISLAFSKMIASKYVSFSLMALTTSLVIPISRFYVRTYLIDNLGTDSAGIWEGMNRLSNMYLMVVTSVLSIYYLPRLSELKSSIEIRQEIRSASKTIIPLLIVFTSLIYLFRGVIVEILFSSDFYEMKELFLYQLIGDVLKISSWMVSILMISKTKTKWFVYTEIMFAISFVVLSVVFTKYIGIQGTVIGYAINFLLYLIIIWGWFYPSFLKKNIC